MTPKKARRRECTLLDKILCLEGEWTEDLAREESIEPLLDILERRGEIEYIHRRCATRAELEFYLMQLARYRDYRVVYLAFHGHSGGLQVSSTESISLDAIADVVGDGLRGRVVFFGSCATLKGPASSIADFRRRTGAAAVAGYTIDVDWVEASAFELMFLYWAAYYKRPQPLFARLMDRYPNLCRRIGFRWDPLPGRR